MHIHILGICGTFMGGVAALARAAGHTVTGSDTGVYPPMSTQLEALGIDLMEGYDPSHLQPAPDCVVVGNVIARGNPAIEYVLEQGLPYRSGPQWLAEHVLRDRHVLAVAGTHGKTTTASMLAWVLEDAGKVPGFLIGGIPGNFEVSARFGEAPFFVVEADEYDTAFFDKRSKFVHYQPRTLVLNNLEFDHADIFDDLDAIKKQFHHLMRTVPGNGLVVSNGLEANLDDVIDMGCWTPVERFMHASGWSAQLIEADGSHFSVQFHGVAQGEVQWSQIGQHNVANALAVIAAARHVGITPADAIEGLGRFKGVKRRMELRGEVNQIKVYDDFAHHPTAIATTLAGAKAQSNQGRVVAILEPRSNSMKMGAHSEGLAESLQEADWVVVLQPQGLEWSLHKTLDPLGDKLQIFEDLDALVAAVTQAVRPHDCLVVMSNGAFGGVHQRLLDGLAA